MLKKVLLILPLVLLGFLAEATHLIGGYMNYTYLETLSNGNLRYKVSLNLYRDCFQSEVPLPADAPLGVYLNNTNKNKYTELILPLILKQNVRPPGTALCDFYDDKVCIEYGFYEGIIDLPPSSSGYHMTFERCCRNIQDNITEASSGTPNQGQTYAVYIPPTIYQNSSPVFSGIPSPYMCARDTTIFDFAAYDPDGDSLSYRLVHPYAGASLANSAPDPKDSLDNIPLVQFSPGYTFTRPFGVSNGSITTVNSLTGLTTFLSPSVGSYIVAIEVTEWRNGVALSTVRMDLQILVLDCPPNDRPQIEAPDGQSFIIEEGEPLCFDVTATDSDDDFVSLTVKGPIYDGSNNYTGPLATFVSTDGQGEAYGEFCWTPNCGQARNEPYIVRITAEDDGCPPKFNTLDFNITVTPFVGTDSIDGPRRICRYTTHTYDAVNFQSTSTFEWTVVNGTIVGVDDSSSIEILWDGAPTGTLSVTEVSQWGCRGDTVLIDVIIDDSPPLPIITGKDTVCESESGLIYQVANNAGSTYQWFVQNGNIASSSGNSMTLGTYNQPTFEVQAIESNSTGCSSDTARLQVFVSIPDPAIGGPTSVCPNATDVAYFTINDPGSTYSWTVTGGTITSGNGSSLIRVDWGDAGVGTVSLQETNQYGCVSTSRSMNVDKSYVLTGNPVLGPIDACEFTTGIEYQTLEVTGSVYNWDITGGTQSAGDSSHLIEVDWGAAGSGRVGVQEKAWDLVNNRECLSPFIYLDVTIHPTPTANTIFGEYELCQFEDSVSYSLNGMPGSSYFWTIDGDSTGFSGQGTFEIKKYWDQAGSFVIQVQELSVNGCAGPLVDSTVTIHPKPNTSPITGPLVVCPEDVLAKQYSVTGLANSTFTWVLGGHNQFSGQGTDQVIVDWEPSVPNGYLQVVELSEFGCPGDTQELVIEIDRLEVDMEVVSVGTPDDHIIVEWTLRQRARATEFDLQRRTPGGAWASIATLPGNVFTYTDRTVNPDQTEYEYRVLTTNQCGTELSSEVHRSILLTGIQDADFNIDANFTAYQGWENGVDYYTFYQALNNGPFTDPGLGGSPDVPIFIEHKTSDFRKCYRVLATELEGGRKQSWSNDICFVFEPTIYVPTAVTANNDLLNDEFGIVGVAVKDVHIQIYNRWGEKLFETFDINEKWDLTYKGVIAQVGTYVYLINYTDFEDNVYQRSGTINLIR